MSTVPVRNVGAEVKAMNLIGVFIKKCITGEKVKRRYEAKKN